MKKLLAAIVSLLLVATMIPMGAVSVSAASPRILSETEFVDKLNQLRSTYPNGGTYSGTYYENGDAKAWTCFGYACQMFYEVFGVQFYADGYRWKTDYTMGTIYAGDWVRLDAGYGPDTHSVFVTKVTSDRIYFTDANFHNKNDIRWDASYTKEDFAKRFTYKVHIPGNTLTGTGTSTPSSPIDWATIATGTYLIKNKGKGIYANVEYGTDQNGQNIRAGEYGDWASMKYEITPSTTTEGYMMRPLCSWTRVVNVYGDTVSNGNNVCLWDDTGHNSQRWGFEKVDGGYVIRNVQNPSCVLTVQSDNDIKVQTYTGADSQIWILEPLNCSHTYDNDCDATCNECGEARDVADHVYDNDCDADCNECGVIREVADHTYDDDYDADCNECGAIREVPDKPGDVNGDGAVNARDLVILQQYMAGWDVTFVFAAADVDGNGHVVARDLALLQQYIAGWNVTLG